MNKENVYFILPEESHIMIAADYIDDNKNFIFNSSNGKLDISENYIYIETISEDDLEWGEKGLIEVKLYLSSIYKEVSNNKKVEDYNYLGSINMDIKDDVQIGVLDGVSSDFSDGEFFIIKDPFNLAIYVSEDRMKVKIIITINK